MHINLDPIIRAAKPFDLSIELDGETHRVRRLSNADIKQLTSQTDKSDAEAKALLVGLFEEPAPPVERWDGERIAAVVAAIFAAYQKLVMEKNVRAISQAIAGQKG